MQNMISVNKPWPKTKGSKGMKNHVRKGCSYLRTILFLVTFAYGKMPVSITQIGSQLQSVFGRLNVPDLKNHLNDCYRQDWCRGTILTDGIAAVCQVEPVQLCTLHSK